MPRALASIALVAVAALSSSAEIRAQGESSLIEAAKRRDVRELTALLQAGRDPNAASPDGATALTWAVYLGEQQLVDALLAAGAKPEVRTDYGETPLTLAAANGNDVVVGHLLKRGANPNAARWNGETADRPP
jgi:uncharacterized protein